MSVRTLIYALIVLAGAHVLALTVRVPTVTFLLEHAGTFGFLPLSLSTAAGITRNRTVLIATLLLVLIMVLPGPLEVVARALWPMGVGIVLGTLIRKGIRATKEASDGEPVPPDQHADDRT